MAAIDNLVLLSFKKNDRKRLPAEGERYLEKLSRYQTDTCLARRQVATTLREWLWQALASDEYGNLSGPSLNYLLTLSSVHIFSELLAATLVQPSASMQASTRLLSARLGKRRSAFALSEKSLMNMQVRHPEAPEVFRRSSSFSIHAALLLLSTEPSPQARASNTRSLPGRRFALPGEVKRNGHNSTDAQHDDKHTCTITNKPAMTRAPSRLPCPVPSRQRGPHPKKRTGPRPPGISTCRAAAWRQPLALRRHPRQSLAASRAQNTYSPPAPRALPIISAAALSTTLA